MNKKNTVDASKDDETRIKETESEDQVSTPKGKDELQDTYVKYRVNFRYGLNLRQKPDKQSPILEVLPNGAEFLSDGRIEEVDGIQWLSVEGGWVDSSYLIPISAED